MEFFRSNLRRLLSGGRIERGKKNVCLLSRVGKLSYLKECVLLFGHVIQWHVHLVCLLVHQHCMSVAKRASSDILPAKTHLIS